MQEVWKDITGYEGYYQVSNLGSVRSVDRMVKGKKESLRFVKGRILQPNLSEGYLMVGLCKSGRQSTIRVHRLAAEAFIPNPENKRTVNHIDENKLNNTITNLEWTTDRENCNHGNRTVKSSIGRYKPVEQLSLDGCPIKVYEGIKLASENTGISQSKIVDVLKGRRTQTKGYKWRYV